MSIEVESGLRQVTIHRGAACSEIVVGDGTKRNALSTTGWMALRRTVDELSQDASTRAIVLRGNGTTFCAGSDMTEWIDADLDAVEEAFARMEEAFAAVERCAVPVVAEVSGTAAGAGCQLALACDLRVMAESARIGMPIVRLGINTSPAFAARMSVLIGPTRTRRMLYTGELLDAPDAESCGLVDTVLPESELRAHTDRFVDVIAGQPPQAIRAAKHAVATTMDHQAERGAPWPWPAVDPQVFPAAITSLFNR